MCSSLYPFLRLKALRVFEIINLFIYEEVELSIVRNDIDKRCVEIVEIVEISEGDRLE